MSHSIRTLTSRTATLVLALEAESTHPLADGFRRALAPVDDAVTAGGSDAQPSVVPTVESSTHVAGGGIVGRVGGRDVVIGSPTFVTGRFAARLPGESHAARPLPTSPDAPDAPDAPGESLTPVWIAVDGTLAARAWLGDPIRTDAAESIAALQRAGWTVRLLSGDASSVVQSVGRALGLAPDECRGEATPEDKLRVVEQLGRTGRVVMVGDGVNDAAAIAAATVGIGVHGGAEASLATADVYLTTPGLAPLVELVRGAGRTMRVIRRNIAFSLLYNVAGATLAITGVITPLIAAVLMPLSSLTVVLASWYGTTFAERA